MRTSWISAVIVIMALLGPITARAEDKAEAKQRFEKGVALYNNEDFGAALVEFRAAYAAKPHFTVRYNIGITLYKLHRYAEAMDELMAFIAEGGKDIDPDRKKEVLELIEELDSYVAIAKFSCNVPGAKLFLNGTFVKELTCSDSMALDVGEYDMEVRAKDHESHYQHIEVPGGQVLEITFELQADTVADEPVVAALPVPDPDEPPPVDPVPEKIPLTKKQKGLRAGFGTMLGLTIASGLTGVAFGVTFLMAKKKYEKSDQGSDDWANYHDMQYQSLVADVMFGITGAFAIGTIVLGVLAYRKSPEKQETPKVTLSPWLEAPGLTLQGVF
jgi:tetratricopeptide (TPR) repeat protein